MRSLNDPGSPSAPFTTTVGASAAPAAKSRTVAHFRAVGKPAPPRPRRPARCSNVSHESSGAVARAARSHGHRRRRRTRRGRRRPWRRGGPGQHGHRRCDTSSDGDVGTAPLRRRASDRREVAPDGLAGLPAPRARSPTARRRARRSRGRVRGRPSGRSLAIGRPRRGGGGRRSARCRRDTRRAPCAAARSRAA